MSDMVMVVLLYADDVNSVQKTLDD